MNGHRDGPLGRGTNEARRNGSGDGLHLGSIIAEGGMANVLKELNPASKNDGAESGHFPLICKVIIKWVICVRELDWQLANAFVGRVDCRRHPPHPANSNLLLFQKSIALLCHTPHLCIDCKYTCYAA